MRRDPERDEIVNQGTQRRMDVGESRFELSKKVLKSERKKGKKAARLQNEPVTVSPPSLSELLRELQ